MGASKWPPGPWEAPAHPYVVPSTGEGPNFSNGDWEVAPPLGESGPVAIAPSKEIADLIAAGPEMAGALEGLAGLSLRKSTVGAIGSAIIEATGDGPLADYVCQLLTEGPGAARFALAKARGEDRP